MTYHHGCHTIIVSLQIMISEDDNIKMCMYRFSNYLSIE